MKDRLCVDWGWDLEEWGIKLDLKVAPTQNHYRFTSRLLPLYLHIRWWGEDEEE